MSTLTDLGAAVRTRRSDIGLSQAAVARLSGLSRATINQLEQGSIKDLSVMRASRLLEALGLGMQVAPPRERPGSAARGTSLSAIERAARTASTSYAARLSPETLRGLLLADGDPARDWLPHLRSLLDEAPMSLLANLVEQLHTESGRERAELWKRLRALAHAVGAMRGVWQ